ncbi:MAG: SDR family oxidoreductase [Phycisphaerae bacterium]|nr:SDR family oxidoreductase [Phycisphaerae bacterium]NUQ46453.1 SDR family oxidoreductase [Phycisphaerae bacterium]
MRIVVPGAAGFIGFHLSHRLLDEGHDVVGVDNYTTGSARNIHDLTANPRFTFIEQDIVEPLRLNGPVDMILNMACPASPIDFETKAVDIMRTCSVGVFNLLELARAAGALFLQASTSECYGDPLEHPQRETYRGNVNPIGPRAPYDEGKRFGEALTMTYHRKYGLRTRMVRIFNTYGPRMRRDDGRALPNFICQALKNEPVTVHGDGNQTRSFCYVSDLVEGILRTAHGNCVEPINLGNDEEITIRQAADEVIRIAGSRSTIRLVPRPVDDPEKRRPDLTRAREILGWRPTVARETGFAETIAWFRASQPS